MSQDVFLLSPRQQGEEEEKMTGKHWLLKLLPKSDSHDFLSHFIDQIQLHGRDEFQMEQGSIILACA